MIRRRRSKLESSLISAVQDGLTLECSTLPAIDLIETDHIISGNLLRELALGQHGKIDPRGIRITGARITGIVDLDFIHSPTCLILRNCVIEMPMQLSGAHLLHISLSGCAVPGLLANGLHVDGDVVLDKGFRAERNDANGAVQLTRAKIDGALILTGAYLSNRVGPALVADNSRIGGGIYGNTPFSVHGDGQRGALRLVGARIDGSLELMGATIANDRGPAFMADRIRVDGYVKFIKDFRATCASEESAVRMRAGRITGSLALSGAILKNSISGRLLDVQRTEVGAGFFCAVDIICAVGEGQCTASARWVDLEYFTYGSLPRATWQQWLHILRFHTEFYRPAPYRALAAIERASGHDGNARRVLIEQQRDLRSRGEMGSRLARWTHVAWGALAGYGYRTRFVAVALMLILFLAGVLGAWAGHWVTYPGHHAVERTMASGSPVGTPCSLIEQIGLGIDRGLPLAPAGIRARCDLDTSTTAGQWFTVSIWILQALIWALATLAIAGYTGLIRKPD